MVKRVSVWVVMALAVGWVVAAPPLQARWAQLEDSPLAVEFEKKEIDVELDGKTREVIERQVQILNEKGRRFAGTQQIVYTRDVEEVKILEAKTVTPKGSHPVPAAMIEDKPVASENYGFDEKAQLTIAYPHITPGASTYLKYQHITHKQPFPGYFAEHFQFGHGEYTKRSEVILRSKIPFVFRFNDPHKRLELHNETAKDGTHILRIRLKEPVCHALTRESMDNSLDEQLTTWVRVSAFRDFAELGQGFVKDYAGILAQELTPLLTEIRDSASSFQDEIAQINHVTSKIAEHVRYMGDWRSTRGRFVPRDLQQVYKTKTGDCKDFSANTATVLNSLGHKAYVALVMRGERYRAPENLWPALDAFNHMMVKVVTRAGRSLWIDPTNLVSMAGGIFPDIADRPVLVFGPDGPILEQIPPVGSKLAGRHRTAQAHFLDNNTRLAFEGSVELIGEGALGLAGMGLYRSAQEIQDLICDSLGGTRSKDRKVHHDMDLKSRIVSDLRFQYAYTQDEDVVITNQGKALKLDLWEWIPKLLDAPHDQVGVVWIAAPPGTLSRTLHLKGQVEGDLGLFNVSFSSPWLSGRRTCTRAKDGIVLDEFVRFEKRSLTLADRLTPAYRKLMSDLKHYAASSLVIVGR